MNVQNSTAARLISGSHKIDLMRRQIKELIRMIIGAVMQPHGSSAIYINFAASSEKCIWKVNGCVGSLNTNDSWVNIECLVKVETCGKRGPGGSTAFITNSDSRKEWFTPSCDDVQDAYEDLDTLVEELFKRYPYVKENLQPLLDAAAAEI